MPHKCTKCGKIFKDGDKQILSGCPECGWNKFLYLKEEAAKNICKDIEALLQEEKKPDTPILDRLESVRILGPGSYELNIKALLERDEIVVALKEDGRYIIHLPSVFSRKKGEGGE
ncbi:MAG: Zn-ribbon domain-containing protein [Halobacteriota archaeon]|nr:Zn-ribbon domain-containing protein [Halobacteriota archaeon]